MAHGRSSAERKLSRWKTRNISVRNAVCAMNEQKQREDCQKQKRHAEFEKWMQEAVQRAREEVGT